MIEIIRTKIGTKIKLNRTQAQIRTTLESNKDLVARIAHN